MGDNIEQGQVTRIASEFRRSQPSQALLHLGKALIGEVPA